MGHKGEVNVDQGHRGYNMADDVGGYRSVNPLFMKYTPTQGKFSGRTGYGYRSLAAFIDASAQINSGFGLIRDMDSELATLSTTYRTTAILEAGRRSLDEQRTLTIQYDDPTDFCLPTNLG
jgi:D-galacturonate reductase